MTYELVTPAEGLPVSLHQVKEYLGIVHDEFDVHTIRPLIERASAHVESQLSEQLLTATWKLHLDAFPYGGKARRWGYPFRNWPQNYCGDNGLSGGITPIELERPPIQAVSEVAYTDADGDAQTLASFQTDLVSRPGRVFPAVGETWPATQSHKVNAVSVTFTAGYGTEPDDVPGNIRQLILMLVGHWFHNREAVGTVGDEIALGYRALLLDAKWK